MPIPRRTKRLIIPATETEHTDAMLRAEDAGYDFAEWARSKIFDEKPRKKKATGQELEVVQLRQEMQKILAFVTMLDIGDGYSQTKPSEVKQLIQQEISALSRKYQNDNQG